MTVVWPLSTGGKLWLCVESEKLDNRPRYSSLNDLDEIAAYLGEQGIDLAETVVTVDGWVQFYGGATEVEVVRDGAVHVIPVAGYDERRDPRLGGSPIASITGRLPAGPAYRSFPHATGHLISAYCTSPAAARGEPSLVLVWDGGMPACLYTVDPRDRTVVAHGVVLDITGALYPLFASQFEPFAIPAGSHAEAYLPVSGKAMAYAGLGQPDPEGIADCAEAFERHGRRLNRRAGAEWSLSVIAAMRARGSSDADMIATMQEFLALRLIDGLRRAAPVSQKRPLAFAGGCALNIKWNAALRASGLFSEVWVPPFPNDAGSAIGAACGAMLLDGGPMALEWDVFSGPQLLPSEAPPGWSGRPASIADLAELLHTTGEPVVVLSGRSELGPRALGHRSIIAPAVQASMRDRLNEIKGRERYRPVAPICLADAAPQVFSPGGIDPYMLFDHMVRPGWHERIPAVVHVDGSARLQTVEPASNPLMAQLLREYEARSGIPVLCNTSANLKGSGFFPDAASAMRWGGTGYVWSEGTLYRNG